MEEAAAGELGLGAGGRLRGAFAVSEMHGWLGGQSSVTKMSAR